MENFWVGTQIFIGKDEYKDFTLDDIKKKIKSAKDHLNLNAIMMWTQFESSFYDEIIEYCKGLGVETYAWFPVLADICGFEVKDEDLIVNYRGKSGYGEIGAWDMLGELDEGFKFICSNKKKVTGRVFTILEDMLEKHDFTGFFFDKIRYPSTANGFESLFTCFCSECADKFRTLHGYELDTFKDKIEKLIKRIQGLTDNELDGIADFTTLLNEFELHDFYEFRKNNVYDIVKKFSDYTYGKGKKVGIDLYSYSIADFVSQDYALLSQCCDWIKPMLYCHVIGPAGIPLEIGTFIDAFKTLNTTLSEAAIIRFAQRILGVGLAETQKDIIENGIDDGYVGDELKKIKKDLNNNDVAIYAGVETIINPSYSTNINNDILATYLDEIGENADGLIASWNVLHMPDENLEFIRKRLKIT